MVGFLPKCLRRVVSLAFASSRRNCFWYSFETSLAKWLVIHLPGYLESPLIFRNLLSLRGSGTKIICSPSFLLDEDGWHIPFLILLPLFIEFLNTQDFNPHFPVECRYISNIQDFNLHFLIEWGGLTERGVCDIPPRYLGDFCSANLQGHVYVRDFTI